METNPTPTPDANRRDFLRVGTAAIALGASASPALGREGPVRAAGEPAEEWRNRQPGMAYRRLGRTGMMISEVVCGGDPITLKNYKHIHKAIERGLNYLDMAPAYNGGDTERAFGKILAESPKMRDRVFLTTKVSSFNSVRTRLYRKILDGLPAARQEAIRREAKAIGRSRRLEVPGYFLTYYPGQQKGFESAYLRAAMQPEFGDRVENSPEVRRTIVESILGLRRRGDRLAIEPCIPPDWTGFAITYRFGASTYRIEVANPRGVESGTSDVQLDGRPLPDRLIPLVDDGRPHEVRVTM